MFLFSDVSQLFMLTLSSLIHHLVLVALNLVTHDSCTVHKSMLQMADMHRHCHPAMFFF